MYGIFTYIWLICMVNVGKYICHTWILWEFDPPKHWSHCMTPTYHRSTPPQRWVMEVLLWSIPPSWKGFWWIDGPRFFFQEKLQQNTRDLLFWGKSLGKWCTVIFYLCKNELVLDSLKWFKTITIKSACIMSIYFEMMLPHEWHWAHQLGNFKHFHHPPPPFASPPDANLAPGIFSSDQVTCTSLQAGCRDSMEPNIPA